MEFVSCDPSNYRAGRTQPVRYIVMHYTANNGDTARNNCDYYHRVGGLQASAHYFCDEHGAMQSVRECDTAWHCGARAYWHPECRNANSIGIEMCSRKRADGSYYIKPETVANAATLAKGIMQRYGIDTEHVVRHYDVTGKRCPMPWVDDPAQWTAFLATLMPEHPNEEEEGPMTRYNKIDDMPAWARSDAQRRQSAAADALLAEAKSAAERKRAQALQSAHQEAAQATRAMRARVRDEETATAAAVDAKLPELVTALTAGLLGSDAAEHNAAQIRQWVAPAHEG